MHHNFYQVASSLPNPLSVRVQIVSVVVTLLAILVALFKDSFLRWWNKPILKIEYKNEEPFHRVILHSRSYVRLRIKNVGRSVAKACKGRLVAIADQELNNLSPVFDPTTLGWVEHYEERKIDINAGGEFEYLDLINYSRDDIHWTVSGAQTTSRGNQTSWGKRDGCYLLVCIYSENSKPVEKLFKCSALDREDVRQMFAVPQIELDEASKADRLKFSKLLK